MAIQKQTNSFLKNIIEKSNKMEGKDNRHKDKRSSMKHHKQFHRKNTGNGSSSSQVEIIRGVIDVADSSDDRISGRPISWSSKAADSELENDIENEQMHAADFELLTQMPSSVGGHFQFSSEKNWDSEDKLLDKTEASEYFTLNLNLLNAGLQTIPFYKRLDFPSSWFTKSQLKAMNSAAEIAEKHYQNVLKDHENNPKGKNNSASRKTSAPTVRNSTDGANSRASAEKQVNENDQELDDLLNLTTNEVTKVNINVAAINEGKSSTPLSGKSNSKIAEGEENREGIQQWLDDVLEE